MHDPLAPQVPLAACVPFVVLLVAIAALPLVVPHWWHSNRNKAIVALLCGGAGAAWVVPNLGAAELGHAMAEYGSFMLYLGALFVISGGVAVEGDLRSTPAANTAFLGVGALLASLAGTTGASMLLIRPLLRSNSERRHVAHTVVFFIFLAGNVGGCLTPLGDPPLFLGYLRGVPFEWTFGLWPEWAFMTGLLLAIYWLVDSRMWRREASRDVARDLRLREPLRLLGGYNLVLLAAVVAVVALVKEPDVPHATLVRGGLLLGLIVVSLLSTPREAHESNAFAWGPVIEVAVLFAGLFAAMVPALRLMELRGAELGLKEPWHYFWATGLLSSFLDNAPTYLTFGSLATAAMNAAHPELHIAAGHVGGLVIDPQLHAEAAHLGHLLLEALSLGAVFLGAMTYIGNGPNFMIKAIAESRGVKMPSFVGYMAWSAIVLLPLLVLLTLLFLT
ncbi:MAG TPA: sodium:proton antiporter [Planctomycetota bacterium]|nr:sodium:proton antiporter [Planctomycetota bacterium]